MYWPEFQNAFLTEMTLGLRKRHKALKHKTREIRCERIIEKEDGHSTEKMELDFRPWAGGDKVTVRIFAWADRWIWIDARAATKQGWAWEWTYEGRLLGKFDGREIVSGIENTLGRVHGMEPRRTETLTDIWARLLAQGPQRIPPH